MEGCVYGFSHALQYASTEMADSDMESSNKSITEVATRLLAINMHHLTATYANQIQSIRQAYLKGKPTAVRVKARLLGLSPFMSSLFGD